MNIDIHRGIVKQYISAHVFDESSLSSHCVDSDIEKKMLELKAQLYFYRSFRV